MTIQLCPFQMMEHKWEASTWLPHQNAEEILWNISHNHVTIKFVDSLPLTGSKADIHTWNLK